MERPPRLTVYLHPEQQAELQRLARERGLATSTYVRSILYRHLRDLRANIPPIATSNS